MSNKRTTMRKLRDVLRLRHQAGLSIRAISRSTKLSVGGVQKLIRRAQALQLSWPLPPKLDNARLAGLFYPDADTGAGSRGEAPDWAAVHEELKRPHVTRQLVWEEYTQRYPNRCYGYSWFCDHYQRWLGRQRPTMRQGHRAGEKCFVDYAGSTVPPSSSPTTCAAGSAVPAATTRTSTRATSNGPSTTRWLSSRRGRANRVTRLRHYTVSCTDD